MTKTTTQQQNLECAAAQPQDKTPSETGHTPAPWNYNDMATVVAGDVYDSGATCVCRLRHAGFGDKNVQDIDEVMANGRLIAAAPELLQALKGLAAQIQLGKLNVRKDFSLMNAHAYATKVIHKASTTQD